MKTRWMLTMVLAAFSCAARCSVFQSPIDFEIKLAGNFGEPRPNHFHGGLDIKTEGVEGKHVYAIADGYVSRITMGKFGFGNAVYVTHPTGQTSVYAHLRSFSPRIKAALRRWQYEHHTSVADAQLSPMDCPVVQGQFIALSGNTGASTAPHLHLEIHDTRTWNMLDPYEFLNDFISDGIPPRAHGLMACPQQGRGTFNGGTAKQTFGLDSVTHHRFTAWGQVGFAIWADDYMEGSWNHYGVRETILTVDGREVFHSTVNRVPVEQNRLVNSWGDYDHWLYNHTWYMKSYVEPGNTLGILRADEHRGLIDFNEQRDYELEYVLRDYKGNEARYGFTVSGVPEESRGGTAGQDGQAARSPYAPFGVLCWNRASSYSQPGVQLVVPFGLLATDVPLRPTVKRQPGELSDAYAFYHKSLPLVRDGELSIFVRHDVPDTSKLYITSAGRYFGGTYREGWVTGWLRDLGHSYELAYDDEPPHVNPVSTADARRVVISAYDTGSGLDTWEATVDGLFVVFDAIEKTSSFVCDLRETPIRPTGGTHRLVFTATDNRQNSRTYETQIIY